MNEPRPALDNLTLARKEGWKKFVNTPDRVPPEQLNRNQLEALSDNARSAYDRERRDWHANLGTLRTRQLADVHEDLWDIIDSNAQDCDKPKGAVAIDAVPGLGKTTAMLAFAKAFHRREIAERGEQTRDGNERWPVCRVGLTGNTGLRDFNRAMLSFYAHPGQTRGSAADFAQRALNSVLECETKILIVDDLHFLRLRSTSGVEVSNHFKYIANEFPVTMIFAGVDLKDRGMFSEGDAYQGALLAQTGRRTTRLTMDPFDISRSLLTVHDVADGSHRGCCGPVADGLSACSPRRASCLAGGRVPSSRSRLRSASFSVCSCSSCSVSSRLRSIAVASLVRRDSALAALERSIPAVAVPRFASISCRSWVCL